MKISRDAVWAAMVSVSFTVAALTQVQSANTQAAGYASHHVLNSNTGDLLVGKDLPRIYKFTADGPSDHPFGQPGRTLVCHLAALLKR